MKVSIIPYDEVVSLPKIDSSDATRIDVFDRLGTQGCQLECRQWQAALAVYSQRAATPSQKREKAKQIKKLSKASRDSKKDSNTKPLKPFTLEELKASAKQGCGCCQFINHLLECLLSTRQDFVVEQLLFEWARYNFLLQVKNIVTGHVFFVQFFCPSGSGSIINGAMSSNFIIGDTSSTKSFEMAHQWIEECETTHDQCGSGYDTLLPGRCLDVKPRDGANGPGIKLVNTKNLTGTYACLSHCWGKDPMPIRNTMLTLDKHLESIAWSSLPKTFQDAIIITRRLVLRYLWIDSLCIIQDSVQDWQIESSKMADIYRNSFVTIAAVSSSDFRGGCLSPGKIEDVCFRLEADGLDMLFAARHCLDGGLVNDIASFSKAFPLFTRAWIYQERMLSRRILYCNHREFQFECRKHEVCECGNRFMPPHPTPKTAASEAMLQSKAQYAATGGMFGSRGNASALALSQYWQRSVTQYTKLNLTKKSDTLPALSGCAKDVARLTNDVYAAGIWQSTFAEGMLWTVRPPVDQSRPLLWRAPSWSWASVDTISGIEYAYAPRSRHRQEFQRSIESVQCDLAGVDSTGEVTSGFFRLKTSLLATHLRRICRFCVGDRGKKMPYNLHYNRLLEAQGASRETCSFKTQPLDLGSGTPSIFPDFRYNDRVDFEFSYTEEGHRCKIAPVWLLHLYDSQPASSPITTEFFLMLRHATSGKKNTYERVGIVTVEFPDWDERSAWFQDVHPGVCEERKLVTVV